MSRRSVMCHVLAVSASAAWIVAQTGWTFPFRTLAGQRAQIARLEQGGYQVVFRRGAYLVLHRPLDQLVHQQRRGHSR